MHRHARKSHIGRLRSRSPVIALPAGCRNQVTFCHGSATGCAPNFEADPSAQREAPVVHDDDTRAVPTTSIPPDAEPLASARPLDQRAHDEIQKIAHKFPNLGPLAIQEEARRRGLDVDELAIKDVLRRDKLRGRDR